MKRNRETDDDEEEIDPSTLSYRELQRELKERCEKAVGKRDVLVKRLEGRFSRRKTRLKK